MIYKQLSYLPIIFQVDEDIILNIQEFLKRNKLVFNNVLVVSGDSHSKYYADKIANANTWSHYILKDNTYEDVQLLKQYCETNLQDLIVAVGGGKVLDTVKRVSYLANINHLSVPTIISNDGLISPISVIKNDKGQTESIPGMMPMGVVIDLEIIKDSPIKFIRAAAGDILSNISATNDWVLAFNSGKEGINDIAFHLSKSAANSLLHFNKIDLYSKSFLRLLVQGQVNSGISMALAGTSRPCSGSEHLISHALDYFNVTPHVLHGTQVASISLFTLFLQGKLNSNHLNYAKATQIPFYFTDLMTEVSDDLLCKIYRTSKEMRPGRYTVLDQIDEKTFLNKLIEYRQTSEKKVLI